MKNSKGFRKNKGQTQKPSRPAAGILGGLIAGIFTAAVLTAAFAMAARYGWIRETAFGIVVPVSQAAALFAAMVTAGKICPNGAPFAAAAAGAGVFVLSGITGAFLGGKSMSSGGWLFLGMIPLCFLLWYICAGKRAKDS